MHRLFFKYKQTFNHDCQNKVKISSTFVPSYVALKKHVDNLRTYKNKQKCNICK